MCEIEVEKCLGHCCDAFRAVHHAVMVDRLNERGGTGELKTNARKEDIQKRKSTFNKTMINSWFGSIQTV